MSECRIYLDQKDETVFATVSEVDYQWALQWKWHFTWDRHRRKRYATRVTRTVERPKSHKLYLHKEILHRAGKIQPTPKHHIGDHGDSDSLNDCRDNLEWVTPKENAERKRSKRWRHLPEPANDNHEQLKATA